MADPAGEADNGALRLDFDRRVMLRFHGSAITSDGGLLAYRELDDVLALSTSGGERLAEARHLSWAAPQAHRHVSQRLPIQSALLPARLVRDHARARRAPSPDELLGYRRTRQSPQRCAGGPARTAAPQDSDWHAGRRIKTRKTRTPPRFGFDPRQP